MPWNSAQLGANEQYVSDLIGELEQESSKTHDNFLVLNDAL